MHDGEHKIGKSHGQGQGAVMEQGRRVRQKA